MKKKKLQHFIKRMLDLSTSLVALVLLSPLLIVIAIAVMLTSRGSCFFWQRRLGLSGRPFLICKFRTMYAGSHKRAVRSEDGANVVSRTDSRITPFGRFLRESSLDELPQLWNVLKGEMSLVGPRPDEETALQLYTRPERAKLSMRPGITGLAMVSGRNRIPWRRRIELDIQYCERFSLWLDLLILVKTIKVLIVRDDIYNLQ